MVLLREESQWSNIRNFISHRQQTLDEWVTWWKDEPSTHTQQHTTQFCCKYINKKLICCSGWQEWCNTCTDECKRSRNLETLLQLRKKRENKASVLTMETAVGNIHLSQGQLLSTTCCHTAQLWAAPQFLLCIALWSTVFIASRLK